MSAIERVRDLAGGGAGARVELVRVDGKLFVLKTHRLRNIVAERAFYSAMRARGLPHLEVIDHPALAANQILLEYIEGSPTIGASPGLDDIARWGGAIGAMHAARTDAFTSLDEAGVQAPASWPPFLQSLIDQSLDAGAKTDLSELLGPIAKRLETLAPYQPKAFVLTHGDLHANNALVRAGEVVLFDKGTRIWVSPPAFDLCLIFSEAFPGARYGVARTPNDEERISAFFSGYGPLDDADERWIDHFVLLRALRRYPNPFVPQLRGVVEAALARVGGSG